MNKLTIREQNLVIITFGLAITVMVIFYLLKPLWLDYQQNLVNKEGILSQLSSLQTAQKTQKLKEAYAAQNTLLKQLAEKMPEQPQTAELLYFLQKAAAARALSFVQFNVTGEGGAPAPARAKEGTAIPDKGEKSINFTVTLSGNYAGFGSFIRDLEASGKSRAIPRLVWLNRATVLKVPVQPASVTKGPVLATLELAAFHMPQAVPYKNQLIPKTAVLGKPDPF